MSFENCRARQFFPPQREVLVSWKKRKKSESSQIHGKFPDKRLSSRRLGTRLHCVFPQNNKRCQAKNKKVHRGDRLSFSREEFASSPLSRSCSPPPRGAVCRSITQSRLNFLSGEAVDSHRKGSAGVRNMRSARLFVF